jgi:uncharacterized protein (TIGR03083 family)
MTVEQGEPPVEEQLDDVAVSWGVTSVLTALDHDRARPAPTACRAAVMAHALGTPRARDDESSAAEVFAGRVASLRAIIERLQPADWNASAPPTPWSVHGVVAHLLVIERYTATRLGLTAPPVEGVDGVDDDHLTLGGPTIAAELAREPEATAASWSVASRRLVDHVRSASFRPSAPAPLHGRPCSQASALLLRSLELWAHEDDIRRAVGRPSSPPTPAELRSLTSFAVRGLPYLVQLAHPSAQVVPVRVVLTGPGGGVYDIGGEARTSERVALMALDAADYCRLATGRLGPEQLAVEIEGDRQVVDTMLASASAVAI